jgi:hypothetical protein
VKYKDIDPDKIAADVDEAIAVGNLDPRKDAGEDEEKSGAGIHYDLSLFKMLFAV